MQEIEKEKIKECTLYIIQNVAFDDIRDAVRAKAILSDVAFEKVYEKPTNTEQVSTCNSTHNSFFIRLMFPDA